MTYDETAAVLGLLAVEYRNEVIDEPRIELWSELFKGTDFDAVKEAVLVWFTDAEKGRFFPRPAELRGLVRSKEPKLDARLYRRYGELRRLCQTASVSGPELAELNRIEGLLGLPTSARVERLERLTA
jgi:hypothetical protein